MSALENMSKNIQETRRKKRVYSLDFARKVAAHACRSNANRAAVFYGVPHGTAAYWRAKHGGVTEVTAIARLRKLLRDGPQPRARVMRAIGTRNPKRARNLLSYHVKRGNIVRMDGTPTMYRLPACD